MTIWQKYAAGIDTQPVIIDFSRIPQETSEVSVEILRNEKPTACANVPVKGVSKREVMRKAHQIRRDCAGADWSLCLKEAWRLLKIESLKNESFILSMKDRFRQEDWDRSDRIEADLRRLQAA